MTVHDRDTEKLAPVAGDECVSRNPYQPLTCDPEEYMLHLEGFDMSAQEKRAALRALWHIMSVIVDIGFGMDSVHNVLPDVFEKASRDSRKLLEKKDVEKTERSEREGKGDE